jgi:ubiquinone/menaquinone biosynthesis C-methylase UbiE
MSESASQDVRAHYQQVREAERLRHGPGQLEFARTSEIIGRYLTFPASVLDVGGGTGPYAVWLLEQGCDVDLVDPVPGHVEEASRAFAARDLAGRAHLGDARSLAFPDESRDAVLELGPLYHLTQRQDRVRALGEAGRVVRRGGPIFVAAISRFASLLDGFSRQLVRDPEFIPILMRDLDEGQHRNPTGNPGYFTTAFFHTPPELEAEIRDAGLELDALLAVEGPFWCIANFDQLWNEPPLRQIMLETLRRVEAEPSLLGASAHWLAVARRPR